MALEATLSGRRFRLVRSPAWERPKKRGTGTTTQQASVTISERVDGAWQPLSSRLDETGHLVTPPGRHERHPVHPGGDAAAGAVPGLPARPLRGAAPAAAAALPHRPLRGRRALAARPPPRPAAPLRRHATSGSPTWSAGSARRPRPALPDDWDVRDLHAPAGQRCPARPGPPGSATTRSSERTAADAAATAAADAETATRGAARGRPLPEPGGAAVSTPPPPSSPVLTAAAAAGRRRPAAPSTPARRAAAVAPVAPDGDRRRRGRWPRRGAADRAGAVAADDLGLLLVDEDTLAGAVEQAVDDAARVRALLPRSAACTSSTTRWRELERRREHGSRPPSHAGRASTRPCPRGSSRCAPGWTTPASPRSGTAAVEARLAERDAPGRRARPGRRRWPRASRWPGRSWRAAQTLAAARRETWLDLREARLDGMAAEIAGALAVGACCPVCGSAEHPHKARAADGAPDAVAEKEALRLLDDAKSDEQARDGLVPRPRHPARGRPGARRATSRPDALHGAAARHCGPSCDDAARARRARAAPPAAPRGGRGGPGAAGGRGSPRSTVELGVAGGRAPRRGPASGRALRAELDAALAGARRPRRAAACAPGPGRRRPGRAARRSRRPQRRHPRRRRRRRRALGAAARRGRRLRRTPTRPGAALLDPAALARARAPGGRPRAPAGRGRAPCSTSPGAAGRPPRRPLPDLPVLERAARAGARRARRRPGPGRRCGTTRADAAGRPGRPTSSPRSTTGRPLRESLELATRLAAFVEGKSADNRLQMRLSAYVLAYRLSQVVAAANERLARMSDQRYSLEHTGRRGAGRDPRRAQPARARRLVGRVARPGHAVRRRDVRGLAGAGPRARRRHHPARRGGADLDTLFVDEGFGSLDADTLDDVMDTLDSLRDGGRVVGVVSHVAEMRDRIPTQLRVTKSRAGSTLAVSG